MTGSILSRREDGGGLDAEAHKSRRQPGPRVVRVSRPAIAVRDDRGGLAGVSDAGALAISVGLMIGVAVGDLLTGYDVNFTLLYLGPIGLATWFVSFRAGTGLSLASALLSVMLEVWQRPYPLPTAVLAWNLVVQLGVFMALVALLTALQSRLAHEQQAARTDPLTAVSNRRSFEECAEVEVERARRSGRPLTVVYLDVDDFKRVNDLQGHARGDALLATLAATLRGATRAVDVVGRLGGDEFGLLLVEADGPTAQMLLHRLRDTLDAAIVENGWRITFSIGAATYLSPPRSVDDMMGRADQLMYEAKRAGKNALRFDVLSAAESAAAAAAAARRA